MKRLNIYSLCLSALMLCSCGKFLEPKSENEFVAGSVQDLDELLMFETYYGGKNKCINPFFDLFTDDAAVVRFKSNENNLMTPVHLASIKALYTWQPDAFRTLNDDHLSEDTYDIYSGCYSCILGCNAVLDYIDKVSGTAQEKARVTAEALSLRAFYYFHLVNCFGKPYNSDKTSLGVPLHLVSKVSSATIARNTVEEVYNQVVKDLIRAEELYSEVPETWSANMRVSLPFVQLLLSRVYLYMEDWEKASEYATKVLEDSRFRLMEYTEFPTIPYSPTYTSYMYFHSYTNPEVIWTYGGVSGMVNFINPYMMDSSKGGKVSFVVASDELRNTYKSPTDIRLTNYFVKDPNSASYKAYGKLAVTGNTLDPDNNNRFSRSFRLAEAYLNKAEAEIMLFCEGKGDNHKAVALELLGALRSKRILTPNPDEIDDRTSDRLVNSVRNERRRELCFEDHRWFDLRRWGMPEIKHLWKGDNSDATVTTYTLRKNDPMYTLQIPACVMLKNDKLIQNEAGGPRND